MQILQLVQATKSWMYAHGFKESTVILAYELHWNKFRQAFGNDTEFSKCDVSQFVETTYGTDIFAIAPYELSKTASNARRALNALTEFNSHQAISRHSRSGALTEVKFHLRIWEDNPLYRTEYGTYNSHLLLTERKG